MTHLGSGIWSYSRRSTGAIFFVTVPATINRSDWRGEARNTSAPKREMSKREADAAIISIAQHARPKPMGHSEFSRAHVRIRSTLVVMKLSSNLWSMRPIGSPRKLYRLGRSGRRNVSILSLIVRGVQMYEIRPFMGSFVQRVDRLDRAGRDIGATVDTLVRMDVEHVGGFERRL